MSTPPVPPADAGDPKSEPKSEPMSDRGARRTERSDEAEHDPTGIRALLSALPDPGPMPTDLVARITASIAQEQAAREGSSVVPLRRRSWGWQHLGAAAAAAVVLAVGIPALLTGTGPGDVMASLAGSSSSDSAASGSAATAESTGDAAADSGRAAAPVTPSPMIAPRTQPPGVAGEGVQGPVGDVTLASTGTAYTTAGLATQASALVPSGTDSSAKDLSAADGRAGLRACLTALGVHSWLPVHADVATLDGAPAVIAVVDDSTTKTVYAVSPGCDGKHPSVLAGPVTLP